MLQSEAGQSPGPLFLTADDSSLSRGHLVSRVRSVLAKAGMDGSQYSGHFFRIGAATAAAAGGLPDSLIQTLVRWRSDSFWRYIRIPHKELAQVSVTLVGG